MFVSSAKNVKEIEDSAARQGMSYYAMMENAGQVTADEICKRVEVKNKKIYVLCGGGNNGGDGYVAARILNQKGAECIAVPFGEPQTEISQKARNSYCGKILKKEEIDLNDAHIIIDALFGTGLKRRLEGECLELVDKINSSSAYTVSVDIPSGVFADSGEETPCVKADLTVTFIAFKTCHIIFPAREYCGEIVINDIGITPDAFDGVEYIGRIIAPPVFKKRKSNTHKGTYGTASLVVGSYGMAGAANISLKACLKSGVGIAKATVPQSIYDIITVSSPEAVCNVYGDNNDLDIICKNALNADAVLIGCGLSKGEISRRIFSYIVKNAKGKLIIDADGINILSENIECIKNSSADIILTPHPAEMARLCKVTAAEIEKNRIFYAVKLAKELSCTLVLKGAVTVVADKYGEVYFNLTGNPSMAKGGSGDALSGIIVSLAAQGMACEEAARCGVYIHGAAGDMARDSIGEISALPTDAIEFLPEVFKKLGE